MHRVWFVEREDWVAATESSCVDVFVKCVSPQTPISGRESEPR